MGGVIIILTRVMGERLTHGIPAHYCVVLVERLGGLFFDGRRSILVLKILSLVIGVCTAVGLLW